MLKNSPIRADSYNIIPVTNIKEDEIGNDTPIITNKGDALNIGMPTAFSPPFAKLNINPTKKTNLQPPIKKHFNNH